MNPFFPSPITQTKSLRHVCSCCLEDMPKNAMEAYCERCNYESMEATGKFKKVKMPKKFKKVNLMEKFMPEMSVVCFEPRLDKIKHIMHCSACLKRNCICK